MRHHALELKPEAVKPGQTVLIRAVAWDKRAISDWGLDLRPQETASGWHAVKIVAEDAKRPPRWNSSRTCAGRSGRFLEKQIQLARKAAGGDCWHEGASSPSGTGRRAGGNSHASKSISRRPRSTWSSRSARPTARSGWPSSGVLNGLAFGDMLQAVSRCEELMKLKSPADFKKPAAGVDRRAGPDHRRAAEAAWT